MRGNVCSFHLMYNFWLALFVVSKLETETIDLTNKKNGAVKDLEIFSRGLDTSKSLIDLDGLPFVGQMIHPNEPKYCTYNTLSSSSSTVNLKGSESLIVDYFVVDGSGSKNYIQKLLWVSDDGIPDLGGVYEGDTCFADEVNQPALTYPGAYRRVAVELKIHHLAVNALLKSSLVDEMEGGSIFGYEYDANYGSSANEVNDEASSCAPAFRVLKQLIQRCISDAVASGNEYADALLQHLYRWLCSPMSKLHDPALHRVLHKIMKKVFALLLAELQKLGATIIFADFSKIIIDTGKVDMLAGRAYCDCLIKTLQTRDLFEWLELEPLHFWHSLLFMDQHNFGGIQAKSSTDSVAENVDCDSQVDIVSSWSISDYLPKVTQDHFVLIVSEFLYLPWKYLKEQIASFHIKRDITFSTQSITVSTAETLESCVNEYLKDQISCYFSEKLLKIVCDTLHHFKGKNNVDLYDTENHGFKHYDSSHSNKGNGALEFIKHVCMRLENSSPSI